MVILGFIRPEKDFSSLGLYSFVELPLVNLWQEFRILHTCT